VRQLTVKHRLPQHCNSLSRDSSAAAELLVASSAAVETFGASAARTERRHGGGEGPLLRDHGLARVCLF
jgi:hypothetical protein